VKYFGSLAQEDNLDSSSIVEFMEHFPILVQWINSVLARCNTTINSIQDVGSGLNFVNLVEGITKTRILNVKRNVDEAYDRYFNVELALKQCRNVDISTDSITSQDIMEKQTPKLLIMLARLAVFSNKASKKKKFGGMKRTNSKSINPVPEFLETDITLEQATLDYITNTSVRKTVRTTFSPAGSNVAFDQILNELGTNVNNSNPIINLNNSSEQNTTLKSSGNYGTNPPQIPPRVIQLNNSGQDNTPPSINPPTTPPRPSISINTPTTPPPIVPRPSISINTPTTPPPIVPRPSISINTPTTAPPIVPRPSISINTPTTPPPIVPRPSISINSPPPIVSRPTQPVQTLSSSKLANLNLDNIQIEPEIDISSANDDLSALDTDLSSLIGDLDDFSNIYEEDENSLEFVDSLFNNLFDQLKSHDLSDLNVIDVDIDKLKI